MAISLLKGRSSSRWRRAREVSAQVSCSMRSERGGELPVGETGSGSGAVRARAMLQLLAPMSRTWGICLLMSWVSSVSCLFQLWLFQDHGAGGGYQ